MGSVTVLGLVVTTALLGGLAAVAWRSRAKQGATAFAVLQVVSAVWTATTTVGLMLPPGPLRIRLWGVTSGLSLFVIVPWLGFILSYTGRGDWLAPRRLGGAALPLVFGGLAYLLAPRWPLLIREAVQHRIAAGTVVTVVIGPLGSLLGLYVYLVFLVGLGLVVKTVLEGPRLFVGQALTFVFGSLITIVASMLVLAGVPVDGYPLTQVALGPQALLWGYAVFGQQLIERVPAVAEIGETAVFDDLEDGVLVVDDDGVVVRDNPAARAHLDVEDPVGDPVGPLLDQLGVGSIADLPARGRRAGRTYLVDASRIRNWQNEPVGHALLVRDITSLVTREQRLDVLNRILRHNVRTEMNVVLGVGEQLEGHDDEAVAAHGTRLRGTAERLTDISETANDIDRLFQEHVDVQRVSLPELVDAVVSPLAAEYPAASVDVSVDAAAVHTDAEVFGSVLKEVVANALEHAGDAPTVRVAVAPVDAGVAVTVTDDGPGIPPMEVTPLGAGEETPLEHATSVGVWFVTWGMQVLGGTVDFEATGSGTRVTLTVPDRGSVDGPAVDEWTP